MSLLYMLLEIQIEAGGAVRLPSTSYGRNQNKAFKHNGIVSRAQSIYILIVLFPSDIRETPLIPQIPLSPTQTQQT